MTSRRLPQRRPLPCLFSISTSTLWFEGLSSATSIRMTSTLGSFLKRFAIHPSEIQLLPGILGLDRETEGCALPGMLSAQIFPPSIPLDSWL